jgi:glycosyl hydrolase family 65
MDLAVLTSVGRRFEAVLVLDPLGELRPGWVETLSGLDLAVGIVSPVPAADHGALPPIDTRAGLVLIASTSDPWCVVADSTGSSIASRVSPDDGGEDGAAERWVRAELWARGIGAGDVLVASGRDGLSCVADQRAARGSPWRPVPEPGWGVEDDGSEPNAIRVNGSRFALADGRIGVSGASLASRTGVRRWVLIADTYILDGPDTHLVTGPIALQLACELAQPEAVDRVLDLHGALLYESEQTTAGPLAAVRFASLARPGTLVCRSWGPAPPGPSVPLTPPELDAVVDAGSTPCAGSTASWMRVAGAPGGVTAAALDRVDGSRVDRIAVYCPGPDRLPEPDEAVSTLAAAAAAGFDELLAEHRAAWASRWRDADVVIEGDDELQTATRYALFHLMASVADDGEAAVGARGLTGTGYRGHVFWDADTFTLPFLAATHPAAARAMLEYRVRRLPAAQAQARALDRAGARFPWESAHTGIDVTPVSARDRTGRLVPIRTGQLEEHIVAQVAWAACCYVDWTGDDEFANGPGRDLLVETARYWASRVRVEPNGAHIYGVIGPDEYHEPVDDNAFTNVVARWNLRRAADVAPDASAEAARWREIADALIDGYDPDTGVYEQFAGFHRLEPLIIEEVAPRRPIAADLLLGADRVHGAQVLKQADVLMLHHLLPEEVEPDSLEPNMRFYEPRTAHGSSLSPGVHASLFARLRDYGPALDALRIATRLDLDDLTETTATGLHLATMGSLWQALAWGFAGLRPRDGRLEIDPRLPHRWAALELAVQFHGARVGIRIEHGRLSVRTDQPLPVSIDRTSYLIDTVAEFERHGHLWRLLP